MNARKRLGRKLCWNAEGRTRRSYSEVDVRSREWIQRRGGCQFLWPWFDRQLKWSGCAVLVCASMPVLVDCFTGQRLQQQPTTRLGTAPPFLIDTGHSVSMKLKSKMAFKARSTNLWQECQNERIGEAITRDAINSRHVTAHTSTRFCLFEFHWLDYLLSD